ncbi:MAG TPA: YeeE/YedE family protein [Deltaproteobacteria bacterium]|nr:YeeE/YedE family protein [Deltaproteobacteria bacterium]
MIKTFYGLGVLDSSAACFTAFIIGLFFGLALERAGFGSSKRLAGIFYFNDMAVLKVMFSALLTAMLGLSICISLGWIDLSDQVYLMKTYFGAYIVAGLLFGVGFVMGGWCPGTAAVGMASGKIDAAVFFGGAIAGSILFNELYPIIKPLYTWGESHQNSFGLPGVAFFHTTLGLSKTGFAFLFTAIAVCCFWAVEALEKKYAPASTTDRYLNSPFLKSFSLALIVIAGSLFLLPSQPPAKTARTKPAAASPVSPAPAVSEKILLEHVASAQDHVEPEELADYLMNGIPGILVVDVRPSQEYRQFHIRGALNVQLPDLPVFAEQSESAQKIVLYSNGMTHPAQARDALFRMGYTNVFILTDGLTGFADRCLKPVSLRTEPLPVYSANQINRWRAYFYGRNASREAAAKQTIAYQGTLPSLINTEWLSENLQHRQVKIIDCRDQPEYNRNHIPGAMAVSPENFRGVVEGIPSMLLPATFLAEKLSLMGILSSDIIVLVYGGDRIRDATLIGMVFERLGHQRYGILEGGFDKWISEKRSTNTELRKMAATTYQSASARDPFTLSADEVFSYLQNKSAVILDVRPVDYYTGKKSDEARGGHIPGALNRPFTEDIMKSEAYSALKPVAELEAAYASLLLSKETPVIVHCRTGHQASQTYFVLKHILKYKQVFWYDAGWTEWSTRKELPVTVGTEP